MPAELPVASLKAELFKSLGHPLRVRALEQLVTGERSVGQLADEIGTDVAQLSQQLGVLRRAAVVLTRREGNTVFYSVRDPRMATLLAIAREMLVASLEDSQSLLASLQGESTPGSASPRRSQQ